MRVIYVNILVVYTFNLRYTPQAEQIRQAQAKITELESLAVKVRADAAIAIDDALQARPDDTVTATAPAEVSALAKELDSAVRVAEGQSHAAIRAAVTRRDAETQARLVASLQEEYMADDLAPPAASVEWSEASLRTWFESGGSTEPPTCVVSPPPLDGAEEPAAAATEPSADRQSALETVRNAARDMARAAAKEAAEEAVREVEQRTAQVRVREERMPCDSIARGLATGLPRGI